MATPSAKTIAITGGLGNLGWKLINHLVALPGYDRLIALDIAPPDPTRMTAIQQKAIEYASTGNPTAVEAVVCDIKDFHDPRWRDVVDEADAIVHFAAQNPYPEAGWGDSAASMDMTLNIALAAAASATCKRVVFATSNHVMGRYKDAPLADQVGPSELYPELEGGVGTVWHTGETEMDSTAYAVAKFAGERICHAVAQQNGGQTTFVCVRIGWCQPGENRSETLSASGSPTLQADTSSINPQDLARSESWFRGMWLSNRDFTQLFERAINADAEQWPTHSIIVNGMSDNRGMKWSLRETRQWLGYAPMDGL